MKNILLFVIGLHMPLFMAQSQKDIITEEKGKPDADSVKRGWTFGGVPLAGYDRDLGLKYGALVNFYNFGDGTRYPAFDHSFLIEYSRSTKGNSLSQFSFDSDRLFPGIRTVAEVSYITEQGLDFYGFNGYQAKYNYAFETDDNPEDYISRVFYRQERKLMRLRADFSGDFLSEDLKWFAGIEFYNIRIDTVDLDKLNKGKEKEKMLPPVQGGLYYRYLDWGIIPSAEALGGKHTLIKGGLIFDTRDNEPNPMKGTWTEAIMIMTPGFLGDKNISYAKLAVTHRQYFTLIPRDMNFTYRLSYQGKLFGQMPSYMLPFIFNSPPSYTRDGLGGGKTVRGIFRNRVVGEGYFYSNLELRWKFLHTKLFKQNFYIAMSTFLDAGGVVQKYEVNTTNVPDNIIINDKTFYKSDFFSDSKENLHFGAGGGLHFAINENFIVAIDYGVPFSPEKDGGNALYINMNWLY